MTVLLDPTAPGRSDTAPAATRRRRRRGLDVLAVLVLPAVLAGGLATLREPVHAAQADVLHSAADARGGESVERDLATQQVLILSRPHLQRAARDAGLAADDLADAASVEVVDGSSILRLRVVDAEPDRALRAAESLVEQYREAAVSSAPADPARALLVERLDAVDVRLGEVTDRLAQIAGVEVPGAAERVEQRRLEAEAQDLRAQVSALRARVLDLDVAATERGTARVLAGPFLLDEPVGRSPLQSAAAGLLLGGLLAVALVSARRVLPQRRPVGR